MMTKERILDVAYSMALSDGFNNLTRDGVAVQAGVAQGTVNHHFKTMDALRNDIVTRAIEQRELSILAQALARGNKVALTAPKELQLEALTSLAQ